jgi:L-lactate dehydrogenase (cytochrome)
MVWTRFHFERLRPWCSPLAEYFRFQIPTLASCSLDEMIDAAIPGQVQFLQLYVNADRERTRKIVQHAEARGIKALFITVDAPQLGRREKVSNNPAGFGVVKAVTDDNASILQDMRMKFEDVGSNVQNKDEVKKDEGAARAISSFIDPSLSWKDLAYFKKITKMPILLKGVQCWEVSTAWAERLRCWHIVYARFDFSGRCHGCRGRDGRDRSE